MKKLMSVLLLLGLSPWAGLHAQQSATTTFRVSVKVEGSCDVAAHGTTTLRATCSPNTTYTLGLDKARSPITVTGVGTGEPVDHTLFGGVPAAQAVSAGDFPDYVTVRIHY